MRAALIGLLLLAGCGGEAAKPGNDGDEVVSVAAKAPVDDGMADCAIGPDAAWGRDCTVERSGDMLVLRHGDGGFRRFRVLADGRGLEAADGSEIAQLQIVEGDRIEMRIGGDRYRLPVKIAGQQR